MDRRTRIINTLNHKESGIIPFHADYTKQAEDRILKYNAEHSEIDRTGVHIRGCQYSGWPTEIADRKEFFKDDFGVIWNRSGADKDIGVVTDPVISEPDISLFREPKLDEKKLRKTYEDLLSTKEDKFTCAGIGFSMFERSWTLLGMENALMNLIAEKDFMHELYDKICEYNLKIIAIANEYPFDGFYFGDDWGQQKGQIMGAQYWREFIKPRMKKMYGKAKENGKYIVQHSCGDIEALFPDLIEIGLDCYQTVQPEIYDIEKLKNEYGNDLTFWGGISTQKLLPFASPEEVKKETARIMRILGKNGGYIAGPTHAVPGDVPPENIKAMFEVFHHQERYL